MCWPSLSESQMEGYTCRCRVGIVSYLGHGPGWVSEGEKDPAAHWQEQRRVVVEPTEVVQDPPPLLVW